MKGKKKIALLVLVFLALFVLGYFVFNDGSVFDRQPPPRDAEGYTYETVQIGNQVWFAENLKTTEHEVGENWCYDDDEENCERYGRLYDWEAASVVCPEGWNLPSDEDWEILQSYINDDEMVGAKLRSSELWEPPVNEETEESFDGLDEYGLSLLPGGQYVEGYFYDLGQGGFWWTSTQQDGGSVWSRTLLHNSNEMIRSTFGPEHAFSVRCMRQLETEEVEETEEEIVQEVETEVEIMVEDEVEQTEEVEETEE